MTATRISTHTLRGERDLIITCCVADTAISTHTLRGERDCAKLFCLIPFSLFQLTRSVGSVTIVVHILKPVFFISTHTLRGERDKSPACVPTPVRSFQLTRSVGSVTTAVLIFHLYRKFQLTRSVGSVTIHIHPSCVNVINFNSHAPWGA